MGRRGDRKKSSKKHKRRVIVESSSSESSESEVEESSSEEEEEESSSEEEEEESSSEEEEESDYDGEDSEYDDDDDALDALIDSVVDYENPKECWDLVRTWLSDHSLDETKSAVELKGEFDTTALHVACRNKPPVDVVDIMLMAAPDMISGLIVLGGYHFIMHVQMGQILR